MNQIGISVKLYLFFIKHALALPCYLVTEIFFSLVGKESFHIMALHFLGFKIVDRIYSSVYGITDAEKIGKFPHSDYGLHISYVIAGVLIPLCLITLLRKVQKYGHFVKKM